jgi:hypothetical protein
LLAEVDPGVPASGSLLHSGATLWILADRGGKAVGVAALFISRESQHAPAAELVREFIGMGRVREAPSCVHAMILLSASAATGLDASLAMKPKHQIERGAKAVAGQGKPHEKREVMLIRLRCDPVLAVSGHGIAPGLHAFRADVGER